MEDDQESTKEGEIPIPNPMSLVDFDQRIYKWQM